jgi:hypothetical protein
MIEELNPTELETLSDLYNSDPLWKSKGTMRPDPPNSLRAGRIIVELFANIVT